jgi:signal transduction histidine kinase/CheY-like chemotaxis protein
MDAGINQIRNELLHRAGSPAEILLSHSDGEGYRLSYYNMSAAALFHLPEPAVAHMGWDDLPPVLASYLADVLGKVQGFPEEVLPVFEAPGAEARRYFSKLYFEFSHETDNGPARRWYLFCFQDAHPWSGPRPEEFESNKLENIGELASGIAHDFNNLIMGIQSNAELLVVQAKLDDSSRQNLVNIIRACGTGNSLTRSLLGYAKRQPLELTEFNLVDMINDTCRIAGFSLGPGYIIELQEGLASDCAPVPVFGCYASLCHCLLNLLKNARDAMAGGGKIAILWEGTDSQACLTVRDHGVGIAPELLSRICEPFYSTKKNGTGLGLAMVHGIMTQHNGLVRIESEVDRGTSVSLVWPLAARPVGSVFRNKDGRRATSKITAALHSEKTQEGKLAYVIDDDVLVRPALVAYCKKLGYEVKSYERAEDAITDLNPSGVPDLILIDYTMSGMNGTEFIRYWIEELPAIYKESSIRLILVSGHPPSHFQEFLARYPHMDVVVLQKPFGFETLKNEVEAAKPVSSQALTGPLPNTRETGDHPKTAASARPKTTHTKGLFRRLLKKR